MYRLQALHTIITGPIFHYQATMMNIDMTLPLLIKSIGVGLILGAVAYRWKQRSFIGWAAIGAGAAAVFPGLSLLALLALAVLPKGKA